MDGWRAIWAGGIMELGGGTGKCCLLDGHCSRVVGRFNLIVELFKIYSSSSSSSSWGMLNVVKFPLTASIFIAQIGKSGRE